MKWLIRKTWISSIKYFCCNKFERLERSVWNAWIANVDIWDVMQHWEEHRPLGSCGVFSCSHLCQVFLIHVHVKYFQLMFILSIFIYTFTSSIFMFLPSCIFIFNHAFPLLLFLTYVICYFPYYAIYIHVQFTIYSCTLLSYMLMYTTYWDL